MLAKILQDSKQNKSATALIVLLSLYFIRQARQYLRARRLLYGNAIPKHVLSSLRAHFLRNREERLQALLVEVRNTLPEAKKQQICELGAAELAEKIRRHEVRVEEALLAFAARAAEVGTQYNYVADTDFSNALKDARAKDRLLQDPSTDTSTLPRLFGVPFAVKEQLKVKNFITTCGFVANASKLPEQVDCAFVEVLREAGAIPFVSGNVPQGLFGLESTNNLYGASKHPTKPEVYSCGGSSGGVAGLVAKRCAPLGVASDSAGSIRFPAATCGIAGFMPSSLRISKKGRPGISGSEVEGLKELLPSIGVLI